MFDNAFLGNPERFADALSDGKVARIGVDAQAEGGLLAARAFADFQGFLSSVWPNRDWYNGFLLHARWSHQCDRVFARLQGWARKAQEWTARQPALLEPREIETAGRDM